MGETHLCNVSRRACASSTPAYIHTSPGPPWHRRPISINTRFPVFPVLRILSLSHDKTGLEVSAGLKMLSRPMVLFGTPLWRASTFIPIMVHREPTSSGSMYTAQTESKEETVREESMRMKEKVMLTYRKYLVIICVVYTYVHFFREFIYCW